VSELKRLRTGFAQAEKLPAYCIFSDATLAEIAACRPKSLDDLLGVRGVGPVKANKYGSAFIAPFADG
jgi:ATP-dependent DNA helicase RecQ